MLLRPPRASDLPALNEMILRSKAHWGYDDDFMAACEAELKLHTADIAATSIQCAFEGDEPVGVAQLSSEDGELHLEKLFVAPGQMGKGIGRALMDWVVSTARIAGCCPIIIEADPDAAPFYEHIGADRAGEAPSGSIPGRMLPRYELVG